MSKEAQETHTYKPKKDGFGSIGISGYAWYQGHFKNLTAETLNAGNIAVAPESYSSTMTGDETFTDTDTPTAVYFLDPNGANRNFNPSGTFNAGFVAFIKNIGTDYNINFDSENSAQIIRPGELALMLYDGSEWR